MRQYGQRFKPQTCLVHKLAPPGAPLPSCAPPRFAGSQTYFWHLQKSTDDIDQEVAAAVQELKALKASVADVEEQIEAVTGIPRNKEAFRAAVVRLLLRATWCSCVLWPARALFRAPPGV